MSGGIDFGRRLMELAERAEKTCAYTYTDFCNMQELSVYAGMKRELNFVANEDFGGAEECERRMIRFGDRELCGYEEPFPISLLEIKPVQEKFADALSHRDFLGSLLGLGLQREKTGDILVKDNRAYAFVHRDIADYIADNLEYVKHTHVKVSVCEAVPEEVKPRREKQRLIVSSNRLDAVIARLYRLSREQAAKLISQACVYINGAECVSTSKTIKEGDVVSVRGHGKFVFTGEAGQSKKERLYVDVEVYI